jgi:type IV pilus assembly protein PilQ
VESPLDTLPMRPFRFKSQPLSRLALLFVLLTPTWAEGAEGTKGAESTVTQVEVREGTAGFGEVVIALDGPPVYQARIDKARKQLIIELSGARLTTPDLAQVERRGFVGGVLAQTFSEETGGVTRVTISLLEEASYALSTEQDSLVVRFSPGPFEVAEAPVVIGAAPGKPDKDGGVLLDVRYSHAAYRDVVELDVDARVRFRLDNSTKSRSTLVLRATTIPAGLERTLDVGAFGGPIQSVSSFREGGDVVLEVSRDDKVTSSVERVGNRLVWSFYEPGKLPFSLTGVGKDGMAARRSKTVSVEDEGQDLPPIRTAESIFNGRGFESEEARAFGPAPLGQADPYAGRRIDLDLKDADIHNVLRLIGDVSRKNIVVADEVKGRVTIRLRNVPWDQALGVILQSKKLGSVEQGNMIRVAPLEQLQKERELEMERRKIAVRLAPIETRLMPISYATASEVSQRVTVLLSNRGSIAVDDRTNTLIVQDVGPALDQVEELVRALDTQTPQVLVEARIVEATSNYQKDVGIQWGGSGTMSATTGNPTGLVFPNSVGITGGSNDANQPTGGISPFTPAVQNPNFAVNLPAATGLGRGGALGLTLGSVDNNVNLAVRLSALETSGVLRILSSPRVLTLDNLEAKISQGTLLPFSQISAQGVQTVFQEAKLQLLVRPHVTADGSVQMRVKVNRDEPDFNQTSARGDPTILKREAQTELLVMDGHTAVIGGIYTRNTGRSLDQVPFFGDIPILGVLFQRRRSSDSRSELVIFITPRIVNRAEALGR